MSVGVRSKKEFPWRFAGGALIGALAIIGSCKAEVVDSFPPPPSAPVTGPAEIRPVSGNGQRGVAGQPLPAPIVARVYDSVGNPVPSVPVTWLAGQGGQLLQPDGTTDNLGTVSATWQLGTTKGTQTATVSSAGIGTVTFSSTAVTVLVKVTISPSSVSLSVGGTQQFTVSGTMSDGSTVTPTVNYTTTGGTIGSGGLYTAPVVPGNYRVIATQASGGNLADTAFVSVSATGAILARMSLSPTSAGVIAGGTVQFSVSGRMSDSTIVTPSVNYTSTGGSITSGGLYTAGPTAGTYRVIATQVGGILADSSPVTITPAPPPPPPGSFMQNRPATVATLILDQPFTTESPWTELFEVPTGAINIVNDATAPRSPSSVLEFKFLNSSYSGSGAGSLNVNYTATNEIYLSFLWYASNPFTWANYSNKLLYVGDPSGGGSNWIIELACHEGSSYNGNFFIIHNNGSDGGYGVADGNFGYPWGYGEGSGNPDHNGTLPIYKVQRGHWYEIEFYAKKGASGSRTGNITYLWARDVTAGEQTSTQLVAMNDANGNVDQSGHVWGHFQLQSILGGGTVDISSTLGQYYHIDQFTAYKP